MAEASIVAAVLSLVALAAGCQKAPGEAPATPSTQPPAPASAKTTPEPLESTEEVTEDAGGAAGPADSAVATTGAQCAAARDCVVVRDECGKPYGAPAANPVAPPAPEHCPPAAYAVTEPACEHGLCIAAPVSFGEYRQCESADQCVPVMVPCGGWLAVHRDQRAQAAQALGRAASLRVCVKTVVGQPPPVTCHQRVCITR